MRAIHRKCVRFLVVVMHFITKDSFFSPGINKVNYIQKKAEWGEYNRCCNCYCLTVSKYPWERGTPEFPSQRCVTKSVHWVLFCLRLPDISKSIEYCLKHKNKFNVVEITWSTQVQYSLYWKRGAQFSIIYFRLFFADFRRTRGVGNFLSSRIFC